MKRHIASALILVVAAVAGNAMADDITIDTTPFVSTMSRAEVLAELVQFKKAGTSPWSIQYNPLAAFTSSKSANEVSAEYVASRSWVAAFNAEDSGSAYLGQAPVRGFGTTLAGQPQRTAQ